jgi:hypothetical protein
VILAAQNGAGTYRFYLFMACIVLAIGGGYVARRTGILKPAWAGRIMSFAIIVFDAPIACLAIWFLAMDPGVWKVPVVGVAVGIATCLVGLAVARSLGMAPADAPVFGLQGGMGNVGYTLGGCLCFALWGIQGLALEQMFCMMWPFFTFLFCFPIGRHYAETLACSLERQSPLAYAARTLWLSLTDLRSLPLYLATLGLVLNLMKIAPPEQAKDWHLIDAMMVAGIFLQFGGVGMTVYAGRMPLFWKKALGSAALKFLVSPLFMIAGCLALGMTGVPLAVCLLLSVMPTALYSVLMANLFGLNKDLANTTFILTHAIALALIVVAALVWHVFPIPMVGD